MNRFVPSVRHVLALTGAALAGTAVAFATPASAHTTTLTPAAECDVTTGEYVVTWSVHNDMPDKDAVVFYIQRREAGAEVALSGIAIGTSVPGGGTITGEQRVPGDSTRIGLNVGLEWVYNKFQDKDEVYLDLKGDCVQQVAKPGATFATACDGKVTVTLTNAADATADAVLVVRGKDGWASPAQTIQPGATGTVEVPAANSTEIKVFSGDTQVAAGARALPANCGGLPVTGVKIGAAVGGALGLLGLGGAMFAVARRRRLRFTA